METILIYIILFAFILSIPASIFYNERCKRMFQKIITTAQKNYPEELAIFLKWKRLDPSFLLSTDNYPNHRTMGTRDFKKLYFELKNVSDDVLQEQIIVAERYIFLRNIFLSFIFVIIGLMVVYSYLS